MNQGPICAKVYPEGIQPIKGNNCGLIPLGQIYHARLRTNCSSLNQHLFSKNTIDSPLCACGAVEDTAHFLFRCHRFNNLRQELVVTITSICQPTSNTLLYGAEYLAYTENKQIFPAVQDFLVKSKRFEIT